MKNIIQKHSDGINLYSIFKVEASKTGKIILSICIIILLVVFVLVISTIEKQYIASAVLPILIFSGFMIIFPVRYLIWNLYGKENLIVNTKSISYFYDYGFFKTNLKTIFFYKLGTGFQFVREDEEGEKGRLLFYNYNKESNLPELIHQTSVLLDLVDVSEIDLEIKSLFEKPENADSNFYAFSEN